jgi:hypothetical protein
MSISNGILTIDVVAWARDYSVDLYLKQNIHQLNNNIRGENCPYQPICRSNRSKKERIFAQSWYLWGLIFHLVGNGPLH